MEEEDDVTEYEKQRLLRIRENKARLEALGLPGLASSVSNSNDLSHQAQAKSASTARDKKRKNKTKDNDDEEYEPSDEDEDGDEEDDVDKSQSSEEEMPSSSSSKRKGKRSSSSNKPKLSKNSCLNRGEKDGDFMDDDIALAEAIALSLGESVANKNGGVQNKTSKTNSTAKKESFRNKNKSRIQLSEDEVIAYFFSFDEVGKGYITEYDVEKMAIAHDFTWTDGEIAKMVRSFDSDGDRKLNLEDFRSIVSRCHMLQEPE
ncbi:EF hand family protein [Rhynchospora pubera]|uniref:EF hand family protein n=2 Tax=Rhynchospora pubera TaxID=906938 RepID=A0AAV8H5I1_9POAL|nr:EF hand family protein [Rhynchospora pubera]